MIWITKLIAIMAKSVYIPGWYGNVLLLILKAKRFFNFWMVILSAVVVAVVNKMFLKNHQ